MESITLRYVKLVREFTSKEVMAAAERKNSGSATPEEWINDMLQLERIVLGIVGFVESVESGAKCDSLENLHKASRVLTGILDKYRKEG